MRGEDRMPERMPERIPYDVAYVSRAGLGRIAVALCELGGQLTDGARLPRDSYARPVYHVRVQLVPGTEGQFRDRTRYEPVPVLRPALGGAAASVERFHATRRMWYYDGQRVVEAPAGDTRGHAEWFAAIGVDMGVVVRGYLSPTGQLHLYQGADFGAPYIEQEILHAIMGHFGTSVCHIGAIPGEPGTPWPPLHTYERPAPPPVVTEALGAWEGPPEGGDDAPLDPLPPDMLRVP